ncbi:MAG: tail fiber protein [Cellvibrionaceae bacterium]|nr:tail fiber protein [Cellvibrionaceae bacterium]
MSDCFVGEIRLFAGTYAPVGWHFCDGTLVQVNDNQVLFSLIGATFGGDGRTTFGLPDLRGRVPVHFGTSTAANVAPVAFAQPFGTETVSLTSAQIPAHTHSLTAVSTAGTATDATGLVTASLGGTDTLYANNPATVNLVSFAGNSVSSVGGSQPHDNMMPTMAMNYIIALNGNYPARN